MSGGPTLQHFFPQAASWVEGLATRPDPESLARVRKVFAEAREKLHRRLHEHGIAH